jgi:hypothetical protein
MVNLPADDGALEELLRDRRFGPPDYHASTPWDFVRTWPDAELRGRVWPVISRLLVDSDELVRARAVEFARVWNEGEALVAPRLLDVAEHHAALYGDQTPEDETLRSALGRAVSAYATADNAARVAAVLREMVRHEPIEGSVPGVLGRLEPLFVAAQVPKWGDAQARWFADAAGSMALVQRDAVIPFLEAVRGLSKESRERILAQVEDNISRDDATAASRARVYGLPPPTKPAPSADDCKRAIGL